MTGVLPSVIKIAVTNAFLDVLSELPKNSNVRPPKKISSPTVDTPQASMIDDRDYAGSLMQTFDAGRISVSRFWHQTELLLSLFF